MARGNIKLQAVERKSNNTFANPFGHSVQTTTAVEAWYELLKRCLNNGYYCDTERGSTLKALFNANYTYTRLGVLPLSLLDSVNSYLEHAEDVLGGWVKGYEELGEASYDYAEIVRDQLIEVASKFKAEPESNSLVLQIASVERYNRKSSPCLTNIKFYFPNKENLVVTYNFRSHDLFKAWLPNAAFVELVTEYFLESLDLTFQPNVVFCGNSEHLHIYNNDEVSAYRHIEDEPVYYQVPYIMGEIGSDEIRLNGYLGSCEGYPIAKRYPQIDANHYDFYNKATNNV